MPKKKTTKKKIAREVTPMQKKAFKEMVGKGRNKGDALRKAGYSEAVATQPQKVTKSKGWQQLMDEHLSDDLLADVHKKGLKDEDANTRHRYLDTAYKVKKKYDQSVELKFKGLDTKELEARAAELIAGVIGDRRGTKEETEGTTG